MSRGRSATSQKSVQDAKKGLQKFLKKLDTIPVEVLQEEAQTLYSEIIKEVPYKTGVLERSVRVSVAKDKKRPGLMQVLLQGLNLAITMQVFSMRSLLSTLSREPKIIISRIPSTDL